MKIVDFLKICFFEKFHKKNRDLEKVNNGKWRQSDSKKIRKLRKKIKKNIENSSLYPLRGVSM